MGEFRYRAFISYAHRDEAFVSRVHNRLEQFVIPRGTPGGSASRRLGRIFRDRDELASGGSLPQRITAALESSEYLIVVCSEASMASRWVNREIAAFVACHGPDKVLPLVADSVPAGEVPLPEAMADGDYVAADARPSGDGERAAVVKVAAGLLDVPYDTLVRREKGRRQRRAVALAGAAVVLLVGVAVGLTLIRSADEEATVRREQAAAFAGVFVDSLQDRIEQFERVGALDADLTTALEFFSTLDPAEMDPALLGHYRSALVGIGTVRIRQGKPDAALDLFLRARDLSRTMVDRSAADAGHSADLATHTYHIGEAYWEMQNVPEASGYIRESLDYAKRAAALQPDNFAYQLEVVFGLKNIGAIDTRLKNYPRAEQSLEEALQEIAKLQGNHPDRTIELLEQEVEAVSWLSEVAQKSAAYETAFGWHDREIGLRRKLIDATDNPHHLSRLSDALAHQAQTFIAVGDTPRAIEALQEKVATATKTVAGDPDNAFFRERLHIGQAMLANALFNVGDSVSAHATLEEASTGMTSMLNNNQQTFAVERDLVFIESSRAYFLLHIDPATAIELAARGMTRLLADLDREQIDPVALSYYLRCVSVLAAGERLLDQPPSDSVAAALNLLAGRNDSTSGSNAAYRVLLLHALGRHDEARSISQGLTQKGYRPAFFTALLDILATP